MADKEKKRTEIVAGGIYYRKQDDGTEHFASVRAVSRKKDGHTVGDFYPQGHGMIRVSDTGDDMLEQWTLVWRPKLSLPSEAKTDAKPDAKNTAEVK